MFLRKKDRGGNRPIQREDAEAQKKSRDRHPVPLTAKRVQDAEGGDDRRRYNQHQPKESR